MENEPLIFTRYLFPKQEVKQALLIALLEYKEDEVLYWGYELFHSGFRGELFCFIYNIYDTMYKNTGLEKIFVKIKERGEDQMTEEEIGSLLVNLLHRNYCLMEFIETYCDGKKCIYDGEPKHKRKNMYIRISHEKMKIYRTVEGIPSSQVLRKVYKYPLRKEYDLLFKTTKYKKYTDKYLHYWLKYTEGCPLWVERVNSCNITETKNWRERICNLPDEFYDSFGYEPDELPSQYQNMVLGNESDKQKTLEQFCRDFGYRMITSNV
jgi:hypothetical protein